MLKFLMFFIIQSVESVGIISSLQVSSASVKCGLAGKKARLH